MGVLLIEGIDGRAEFDTVSCKHCQAIIRVVLSGVEKAYETPYRCSKCHGPICKYCGEKRQGQCIPFASVVERAIQTQRGLEFSEYHYRSTARV